MDITSAVKVAINVPKEGNPRIISNELLIPIKKFCQQNPQCVKDAFRCLCIDLARKNPLTRIRAISLMDYLFNRSQLFRELVCGDVKPLSTAAGIGEPSGHPEVETKVREVIELWEMRFGAFHPQIRALSRYAKESLKIEMPNIVQKAVQYERDHRDRQLQHERIILLQAKKFVDNYRIFEELRDQVKEELTRIYECFDILFPSAVAVAPRAPRGTVDVDDDTYDDVEWTEETAESSYTVSAEDSDESDVFALAPYSMDISFMADMTQLKSSDNAVLHDIIAELCKHLTAHILPKLRNWLDIATNALKILRKRDEGPAGDSAVAEGGSDIGTEDGPSVAVAGAGSLLGKRSYGDIVKSSHQQEFTEKLQELVKELSRLVEEIVYVTEKKCKELQPHKS